MFSHLRNISQPAIKYGLWVKTSVNDQEMLQSQTDTCLQETGPLEHRQIRITLKSQNTIIKAFSSLYLSECIAKLEMTQYMRLTRSAKHEPPTNTTKTVSEYNQEKRNHKLQTKPWHRKAVVAGPAGRRAPDHFFGRVCFPPCPFFSRFLAHFSLCLPLIFNLLMQSSITLVARVIYRPPSQGVKTLKNNAIIILMGRVERKPDVVAFED